MRTFRNNPGFLVDFPLVLNEVFGGEFPKSMQKPNFKPAVNIVENEAEYGIELLAPGFEKDDFQIKIEDKKLIISAEVTENKTETEPEYTLREFKKQAFSRTFTLPENKINEEEIKANYSNGILKLSLPKHEIAKPKAPKTIAIQ
jgi:HSP20 family protein